MSHILVEYDPHELLFKTAGAESGPLYMVNLYPDGSEERTFLFRVAENYEHDHEEAIQAACEMYLEHLGYPEDYEYDFGSARSEQGLWVPFPDQDLPMEVEDWDSVLSVGSPPLGATRGPGGDHRGYEWLYVALAGAQGRPVHPVKRALATANELGRVGNSPRSWGRINYPLRDAAVFLRLTSTTPRAVVFVSVDPKSRYPCHLRVGLTELTGWLTQQLKGHE